MGHVNARPFYVHDSLVPGAPDFIMSEFAVTKTGIMNTPPHNFVPNIFRVAAVLQLIRDQVNRYYPRETGERSVVVNSGYRCGSVNRAVDGSDSSAHLYALAGDIKTPGVSSLELFELIKDKVAPLLPPGTLDQVIHYPSKGFVHVGLRAGRRQFFTKGG